jgi:hypothetical protein
MVRNGRTLTTYVHYDAMPANLGLKTILFTRANLNWIDIVGEQFFALTAVDPDKTPTPGQLAQLRERLRGLSLTQAQGTFDQSAFDEIALERQVIARVDPDALDNPAFTELNTWPDLQDLAHGDLGVFLKVGFLPVLFDGPLTDEIGSVDSEWGYLINLDSREVDIYSVATDANTRIPFDDLALFFPEELLQLPGTIESQFEEEED